MGQPRRRFPGGSVGKFIVIVPDTLLNLGKEWKTEDEAMKDATESARKLKRRVYIAEYRNHVDPQESDA